MGLEDLLGKEGAKKIKPKPFGINPNSKYDRKEFCKKFKKLQKLEGYFSKFVQNPNDLNNFNDLAGICLEFMVGSDEQKISQLENPHMAYSQADALLNEGYSDMADYIHHNKDEVLNELSAKQLYQVFANPNVPLFKTGNKEYDRIKNLRDKINLILRTQEEKGDITSLVQDEVKDFIDSMPQGQREYFFKNQAALYPVLAQHVIRGMYQEYQNLFKNKKGKLDKDKIKDYFDKSYEAAEDFIKDEIPNKEQAAYRHDNLRSYYVEIARSFYKSEKKEQEKDDDSERKEREDEAESIGLRNP